VSIPPNSPESAPQQRQGESKDRLERKLISNHLIGDYTVQGDGRRGEGADLGFNGGRTRAEGGDAAESNGFCWWFFFFFFFFFKIKVKFVGFGIIFKK